jgi:hypothetical protein
MESFIELIQHFWADLQNGQVLELGLPHYWGQRLPRQVSFVQARSFYQRRQAILLRT